MDFHLTKEQQDIQQAAREFAEGEFDKELALELDAKHEFPTEIWQKACQEGFVGLHFPEEFGGAEYGVVENVLVVEEFCRRDSGIGAALMLADFASENILSTCPRSRPARPSRRAPSPSPSTAATSPVWTRSRYAMATSG